MNRTRWIIFTVIVVGVIALLIGLSGGSSEPNVDDIDTFAVQGANSQNGNIADHVFGKTDSKVILIEYGDFQCPPCAGIHPVIKSVTEEYKDQLRFIFRNFPIVESHPNARAAAASAEAAGMQGKYWEMHNLIYESQSDWSDLSINERGRFFEDLARELKLDIDKYNSDLKKPNIAQKIDYDRALGLKSDVNATPTFFLDGTKLTADDYSSEDKLKETIDAQLKKAGIQPPK